MINFLNLEYFLVAAEELNFTRAAKKLFISQQSLSNARFSIYSFPSLSILKIFHVPKAFGSATMRKANTSLSFLLYLATETRRMPAPSSSRKQ